MRTTLYESDVVFMYWSDDPEVYRAYGATVVAWGGAHKRKRVELAHELGFHATGSMWCLTAGGKPLYMKAELREAVVRDIAGNPLVVPWLPDMAYAGVPAYWGCTNHPVFRAFMRKRVCDEMAAGAAGLHVDDHLGTAHTASRYGGCFCDYCMKKFAEYLAFWKQPEMLAAAGVASVEELKRFDYRTLVRQYATTLEEYLEKQRHIPLHQDYVTFQLEAAAENVRQLHRLAEDLLEHPVTLSVNAALPWPPHMVVAPSTSYLIGEVEQNVRDGLHKSYNAVVAYRMAEALGKPLAATAFGDDWAYVKEHEPRNLVCYWIAQAYACGQRLMSPQTAWCYTPDVGSDYYNGPTEVYAPVYQFVRRYAQYFDGYTTAGAQTAVVVNPKSMLFGPGYSMQLLNELAARNVPFSVKIPLDDWNIGEHLRPDVMRQYADIILVDHPEEPLHLTETDRQTVADATTGKRAPVTWPPAERQDTAPEALDYATALGDVIVPWTVENGTVWVLPRKKRNAPAVIHLLNRAYDQATDTFTPQRNVVITLDRSLWPHLGENASLYRYHGDPLPVQMICTQETVRLTIPEVGLWGMVVIE